MGDLSDRMSEGISCFDFMQPKPKGPLDDLNKCEKHGETVYHRTKDCPRCKDDKIAGLLNLIKSMDAYLDSGPAPKKNTICHGSVFHKQMKEILSDG